jgi:hypothetical protein
MSRKFVISFVVGYFLAALAVSLFIEMQKPFASFSITNPIFVGHVLGGALGIYAMSGAIPIIVWAFFRFRLASAHGPLIAWGILFVLAAIATEEGYRFDREQEIKELASKSVLTSRDRDYLGGKLKSGCIERQQQATINGHARATNQQMTAYCDCFANALIRSMTVEEIVGIASGKPSASVQAKSDRLGPECSRSTLGR